MICGNTFHSKRNAKICNNCRIRKCSICGKEFQIDPSTLNKQTCSRQCSKIASVRIREGNIQYGIKKKCKYCGKEFYTNHNRREYCYDDHYATCSICGKQFKISPDHISEIDEYSTCGSAECVNARIKMTNQHKYGVDYLFQDEDFKRRTKDIVQTRYGVDNIAKSNYAKSKSKETCKERYGVPHPLLVPEFKEKSKNSMIAKYGCEYPLQSDEIQSKFHSTMEYRYGAPHALQCSQLKDKAENTCLERFGYKHPAQSSEIKLQTENTCLERFGVSNYSLTRLTNLDKLDNWLKFKNDPEKIIDESFGADYNPTIYELEQLCGVNDTSIGVVINKNNLRHRISRSVSNIESEVVQFIESISDTRIDLHNRTIICPYEIDIYLSEYRLGIECNPTFTHNSSLGDPWSGHPKSINYHKMKSDECENQGIQLFHIFGYEWKYKKDILKSMIQSKLGVNKVKRYARNLYVDYHVPYNESRIFLENNHRQGSCQSSYRIGLRTNQDELVAIMTFGKSRKTIGYQNNSIELLRFCSRKGETIIGGASKLFKHSISLFSGSSKIISFSDRARTSGNIYKQLGFTLVRISDPGYMWVNADNDMYLSRVSCQKHNLSKLFNEEIDMSKTEKQIMLEHGYVQVFDSGTCVWEYHL